jgi:hypothetical protein
MSRQQVLAAVAGEPDAAGSMVEPTARARLRRNRALIGAVALVLAVLALLAWVGGNRATGPLDPVAVDPSGSRALARVLEGQGVRVLRVDRAEDAAAALRADPAATLLVAFPDRVSRRMGRALRDLPVAHVVSVGDVPDAPGPWPRGLPSSGSVAVEDRDPGCGWEPATRAGSALTGGASYDVDGATTCYAGSVVDLPRGTTGVRATVTGSVTLLGSGDLLTNRRLAESGNASLATSVLGRDPVLVWWLPSYADPLFGNGAPTSITDLVPRWVPWAVAQLALGVLVLAYARGRRFGPVVTEPLPVTVRAAETTEGLSRLYRRARGRDHAAARLAAAARRRLASALALPAGAGTTAVVDAVAARTGRPTAEVAALLDPTTVTDDAALVRFADDLDDLERQVRQL